MRRTFLVVLFSILLLASPLNAAHLKKAKKHSMNPYKSNIHSITLKKHEVAKDVKLKLIQLLSTTHKTLKLEEISPAILLEKSRISSRSIHELKLGNYQNAQYIGEISIGESGNTFKVIYDTGSANIWINSAQCSDKGCLNHKQYDGTKFPNYKKLGFDLDVEFGTGGLQGEINADNVYVAGVEVANQNFAEIVHQIGPIFAQSAFDGIVGLAYPTMAAYNMGPLFDNIMKQKKLDNNVFSFFFDNKDGSHESRLILGGVDERLYTGPITFFPVIQKYYWTIKASKILVNGKQVPGVCDHGCKVVADSGTSLLTGPSDELSTLLNQLNVDSRCGGQDKLPRLTFVLENGVSDPYRPSGHTSHEFHLDGHEYVLNYSEGSGMECAAGFMPLDVPEPYGPLWILGDMFFQKYYSVYDRDNDYVGFALAKGH